MIDQEYNSLIGMCVCCVLVIPDKKRRNLVAQIFLCFTLYATIPLLLEFLPIICTHFCRHSKQKSITLNISLHTPKHTYSNVKSQKIIIKNKFQTGNTPLQGRGRKTIYVYVAEYTSAGSWISDVENIFFPFWIWRRAITLSEWRWGEGNEIVTTLLLWRVKSQTETVCKGNCSWHHHKFKSCKYPRLLNTVRLFFSLNNFLRFFHS